VDLESGVLTATDGVELFKRQTQMLAAMSHASLAAIEDWGTETIAGTLYVFTVLESYSGGTLRQILDRGRRLTPSQALVAGLDVCRALHFIHGKGWVHGDVRPANIFIGDDGRVRLAGLGMKRMVVAEKMSVEQANYAAPEIASGEQPSAQSDVYSLATTLLESITGVLPFSGDTAAITLANRVGKLLPVSADLGPIAAPLERAGRPDASERFAALDFGKALAGIAEKMPLPTPIEPIAASSFAEVIEQKEAEHTGELARPKIDATQDATIPVSVSTDPTKSTLKIKDEAKDEPIVVASENEERRHKRLWVIGAVIALLVAGVVGFRVVVKQSHTIPPLAGIIEGEARNLIASNGWTIVVVTERNDDIPAGSVVRTEPEEGSKLKEGQTLTIVVSEGPTFATLPDVSGADAQSAIDQLTALGLVVTPRDTNSEEVPAGTVIGWNVPEQPGLNPGDQLLKGTAIDVLVSVGPELREVPTLVGLKLEDAQKVVADLGLTLIETPPAKSNGADKGLIGAQSPIPGEKVPRDTGIAYSISLGPDLVQLPYIVGNRLDTVQTRLKDAGFVVGSITGNQSGKLKQALIGGKSVKNLTMVARGATVDLVFP
ncbi:MAG: serine/threonine-protein kinase, partial [Actinobacteria bacterium]|nr:serine/threonine-protein kinase [Actinomycetota bacterium]